MQRKEKTKSISFTKTVVLTVLLLCSIFFACSGLTFATQVELEENAEAAFEDIFEEDSETVQSELAMEIDDEELFAGYVNEVMFEQLGDSDIIVQSELAALNVGEVTSLGGGEVAGFGEGELKLFGANNGSAQISSLNSLQKVIYEAICSYSEKVAAGEVIDTTISISFEKTDEQASNILYVKAPQGEYTLSELGVETAVAARDKVRSEYIAFADIYNAVLYNNPYIFYWHDKVNGASSSLVVRKTENGISLKELKVSFFVSEDYSNGLLNDAGRLVQTDKKKTSAVTGAVEEAKSVVSQNAQKSDYYKLCAYRDYICAETSYNHQVSNGGSYGNPWQLIYVFDKDPSTEVVCEGYAKAFKYLCDLSTFSGDIKCSLIGGYMSSGGTPAAHMWNVLTMENGKSYLVDITNADAGDSFAGKLFLNGYVGVGEDNRAPSTCMKKYYQYLSRFSTIKYYAFTKMENLYAGTTVMQLSESDYEANHIHNFEDGYCALCDTYQFVTKTKLAGCALSVGEKARMDIYISQNGNWSSAGDNFIRFTYPNKDKSDIKVSDAAKKSQNGSQYLVFACELKLYQMSDEITVTFHDENGSRYAMELENGHAEKLEYKVSVSDYANRLMNTDCKTGVKDCLQTILLYGGAVQKCINYSTDNLASAGYNASTAHIKKLSDRDIKSLANKNPAVIQYFEKNSHSFEYKKIEMPMNRPGTMKVYVSPSKGIFVEEYRYYVDGSATLLEQDSAGYYIAITGLKPTNYSNARVVTIESKDGNSKVLEITASAYNWVRMALNGESGLGGAGKETGRYIYYLGRYGKK